MEDGEFTLEYFCRLCAAEGVVILHPLFPPGDDDPKDELVRMIDVLTSVTLTRTQDSGAVICDKCLQMLDLFCQFREECLRQDVMIRTRRVLEKERLEEEQRRRLMEQQVCPLAVEPDVQIKEEEPPTIVIDDCKEEQPDEDDEVEAHENRENEVPAVQAMLESSLLTSNINGGNGTFQTTPAEISLYSQTSNLSISVQVNQISLNGTGIAHLVPVAPSQTTTLVTTLPVVAEDIVNGGGGVGGGVVPAALASEPCQPPPPPPPQQSQQPAPRVTFRKGKLDPNKPPPDCELCQERFATHYDFEQHMDAVHAWDKATRCSLACDPCQMRFTKSYNLKRHMYEVHGELAPGLTVTACQYCGVKFLRGYTLNRHIAKMHNKRKAKKSIVIKSK